MPILKLTDEDGRVTKPAWVVLAAIVVLAVVVFFGAKARAADKGGASFLPIPEIAAKSTSWTGCGVGVGASYLDGELSGFAGPVNVGMDGQMLDVRLLCDYQAGGFVIGANADYGKVFGDLQTIGGNAMWAVGGRVGPLLNQSTLLFASGGWTMAETDGGNMDGWYFGGGIETKLPHSPVYLTLEYQRRSFDITDLGAPSGIDATVDVIRAGVAVKMNFGK